MTKPSSTNTKIGSYITLVGITMQLLWFIFFFAVAACFHYRMRLHSHLYSHVQWQRYLGSLYIVSLLVIVRSVFRLAEYTQGWNGYIQNHEAFFYLFDSVPMLGVMVWMNWQHPGEVSVLLRQVTAAGLQGVRLDDKDSDVC